MYEMPKIRPDFYLKNGDKLPNEFIINNLMIRFVVAHSLCHSIKRKARVPLSVTS